MNDKDIRQICRRFVETHSADYDGSHDLGHIDRVVQNAIRILSLSSDDFRTEVDSDILVAIATMHDSFDHKYLKTPEAVDTAKRAVSNVLRQECEFPADVVDMIIAVIDNMGFSVEMGSGNQILDETTLLYLSIIQDADRLDAIGAVGIARCFTYCGAFSVPIITPNGEEEESAKSRFEGGLMKPASGKGNSGISICYHKLVFLKDLLKTPAGRQLGEQRHAFLLQYLDQFFNETSTS